MTRRPDPAGGPRATVLREPLSRESIIRAAMQLGEEDTAQLSLTRLGRALGVDATAVYRHFRDKDELMLALGDQLLHETVASLRPRRQWHTALAHIAWQMRDAFLSRPALAQHTASRFTGGSAELQLRDSVTAVLADAGLTGIALARHCRAFIEMTAAHISLTAAVLTLPEELQRRDVAAGLRLYPGGRVARGLTAREDADATFSTFLGAFIEGVRAAARR